MLSVSVGGSVEEVRPVWLRAVGGAQLQSGGSCSVSQSVWRRADGAERRTGTRICTTSHTQKDHNRPSHRAAGRSGAGQHGAVRAAGRQGPAPPLKKSLDLICLTHPRDFPQHGDYWLLAATGCTLHPHVPTR